MKDMQDRKLKVLCLHGYRQSGEMFHQKTGALRKRLKKYAEFEFISSPLSVPSCPVTASGENITPLAESQDQRGWWFTSEERTYNSKEYSPVCVGFEESLACVEAALQEKGPIDGILGFSQGASFVSILCSMQQRGVLKGQFKFAVMVSGFMSRCTTHKKHYDEIICIPSLHIIGETDSVIPKDMSKDLVTVFDRAAVILHPGGHYVPASGEIIIEICQFLEKIRNIKEEDHKQM